MISTLFKMVKASSKTTDGPQTSRLIVKNLPSDLKEEQLRSAFADFGDITDVCLKYTKNGIFRKFAFVGFKTVESATQAIKALNKSFIRTSRLQIEYAASLGDASKPRAWSKYSQDSTAYRERQVKLGHGGENDVSPAVKLNQQDHKKELFGELYDDPKFREFLTVTKNESRSRAWGNDAGVEGQGNAVRDAGEKTSADDDETENDTSNLKLSDLDYLKSKMQGSGTSFADHGDEATETFAVKMRGFQGRIEQDSIREFLAPIPVKQINIPKSPHQKPIGIAYVYFESDAQRTLALGRNKNFIGTRRIFVSLCKPPSGAGDADSTRNDKPRVWDLKSEKPDETLAESGRLFMRNLSYSCTEDDLDKLFKEFGLLTEVHIPIDRTTKKSKGFAYVSFMMPEHAVAAFTKLDGSVYQGRMLHIMAAHDKKESPAPPVTAQDSSFKNKRAMEQRKLAASSHNWNSLFLGVNAVADTMADKYRTSKANILDAGVGGLGVRMALGETQVVAETRDFLIKNGICLDSFSQAAGKRSKRVILVKNLPSSTTSVELELLFSAYGTLGRIVLPPTGVTAIVEFVEPSEARLAFKRLAYTKFEHVPLYLEWAPMGVFTFRPPAPDVTQDKPAVETATVMDDDKSKDAVDGDDDGDDDECEDGATLSVKNFNFTTTEENIRQLFERCGRVVNVTIARKKDIKNPGQLLSMGYGFVQYWRVSGMNEALKRLQHTNLDGHALELRVSHRATLQKTKTGKRKQDEKKQTTTKILVRNIPFEAKQKEIAELFKVFGELKYVRIPKKVGGAHRGFGFVDFLTKQEAKRAFDALCHSTHLYGRRLVLEWAQDSQDLEELRQKTAENFQEEAPAAKRFKKSSVVNDLKTGQKKSRL